MTFKLSSLCLQIFIFLFYFQMPVVSYSKDLDPLINQLPYKITDFEVLEYLFQKAVRISGLKAYSILELPPIYSVSQDQLSLEVCPLDPDHCRSLAAVFDDIGYRILIRDDLKISSNFVPLNYSFLIHEIIHSLQYRNFGAEIFNGCEAIYKTEKLAYESQDQYLKEEGDFFRAGQVMKYFYCDEIEAQAEYLKSQKVWLERQKNNFWPPSDKKSSDQ